MAEYTVPAQELSRQSRRWKTLPVLDCRTPVRMRDESADPRSAAVSLAAGQSQGLPQAAAKQRASRRQHLGLFAPGSTTAGTARARDTARTLLSHAPRRAVLRQRIRKMRAARVQPDEPCLQGFLAGEEVLLCILFHTSSFLS